MIITTATLYLSWKGAGFFAAGEFGSFYSMTSAKVPVSGDRGNNSHKVSLQCYQSAMQKA